MRRQLCALAATCLLALGCEQDHCEYEIEITPRGQVFERKLSVWQVKRRGDKTRTTRLAGEKLSAITKLYEKRLTGAKDVVQTFVGTFKGRTPNDVGGAGSYTRFETTMGFACIYAERFRGRDDQAGRIEESFRDADTMTDHLIKWFATEMADKHGFDKLRTFMDESFRKDLKNLNTYIWAAEVLDTPRTGPDDVPEMYLRMAQYLLERGYFEPERLPEIMRAVGSDTNSNELFRLVQRAVADRMGLLASRKIPTHLAFLANEAAARESLEAYLRTTEEYQDLLKKWQEKKKTDPEAAEPSPMEVLNDLDLGFGALLSLYWGTSADAVQVKLLTQSKPWLTNGQWDPQTGQVQWDTYAKEDDKLPTMCYALWAKSNDKLQKKHFGKVVLAGEDLTLYCIWRLSLTKAEGEEWDDFVRSFKSGPGLKEKLDAFHFSHELSKVREGEGQETGSYAENATRAIIRALFGSENGPDETAEKPSQPPAQDKKARP